MTKISQDVVRNTIFFGGKKPYYKDKVNLVFAAFKKSKAKKFMSLAVKFNVHKNLASGFTSNKAGNFWAIKPVFGVDAAHRAKKNGKENPKH